MFKKTMESTQNNRIKLQNIEKQTVFGWNCICKLYQSAKTEINGFLAGEKQKNIKKVKLKKK